MRAYVTSCGEKTAQNVVEELERIGFEVVHLSDREPWINKYKTFISLAIENGDEYCVRIDADTIPNDNLLKAFGEFKKSGKVMGQALTYGLYANNLIDSVCFYSREALLIAVDNLNKLEIDRPESYVWRLPKVNKSVINIKEVVGFTSFFQDRVHLMRHYSHKSERGQLNKFNFDLAIKLLDL